MLDVFAEFIGDRKMPRGELLGRRRRIFSVPVRRRLELDRNRLFVLVYVIPLAERMPARCNHLNQDLALRDLRNLDRAFLIRLEAQLGEFLVVQEPTRHVVPDINARVRDGLIVAIPDLNPYLRGR